MLLSKWAGQGCFIRFSSEPTAYGRQLKQRWRCPGQTMPMLKWYMWLPIALSQRRMNKNNPESTGKWSFPPNDLGAREIHITWLVIYRPIPWLMMVDHGVFFTSNPKVFWLYPNLLESHSTTICIREIPLIPENWRTQPRYVSLYYFPSIS